MGSVERRKRSPYRPRLPPIELIEHHMNGWPGRGGGGGDSGGGGREWRESEERVRREIMHIFILDTVPTAQNNIHY